MEKIKSVKLPSPDGLNSELYGISRRKIDLKTETRGGLSSKFSIKQYYHTTWIGSFSFTWAGFSPKYIEINAVFAGSSTTSVTWYWYTDGTSSLSYFTYESGSGFIGTWVNSQIIFFYNSSQSNDKRATLISLDADWFTVNFTRSEWAMYFIVKYYW